MPLLAYPTYAMATRSPQRGEDQPADELGDRGPGAVQDAQRVEKNLSLVERWYTSRAALGETGPFLYETQNVRHVSLAFPLPADADEALAISAAHSFRQDPHGCRICRI